MALWLINAGVWLVVFWALLGGESWMLVGGRLLEIGAAVAFSLHLWQRIVPRNYQPPHCLGTNRNVLHQRLSWTSVSRRTW